MTGPHAGKAVRRACAILLGLLLAGAPQVLAEGSASKGQALFTGQAHFKNGGPACASCHSVAGIPLPQGGTMGPDLTKEYSKLGAEGMQATLETLYFPAMNALFTPRPLTPDEQQDLAAFFQSVKGDRPESITGALGLMALAGLALLLGITWLKGRRRIRSVRGALLERAGVTRR